MNKKSTYLTIAVIASIMLVPYIGHYLIFSIFAKPFYMINVERLMIGVALLVIFWIAYYILKAKVCTDPVKSQPE